jgi:hypothetical protein
LTGVPSQNVDLSAVLDVPPGILVIYYRLTVSGYGAPSVIVQVNNTQPTDTQTGNQVIPQANSNNITNNIIIGVVVGVSGLFGIFAVIMSVIFIRLRRRPKWYVSFE